MRILNIKSPNNNDSIRIKITKQKVIFNVKVDDIGNIFSIDRLKFKYFYEGELKKI